MRYRVISSDNLTTVLENESGETFSLNTDTYAALSTDPMSPLYCVSVSNNSFSIDLWRGCQLNCAYCHVQGCYHDLRSTENGFSMCYKPERRNTSSIAEIVASLVSHSDFIPHYSLISICTSSTEPFMNSEVIESTLSIMNEFAHIGLRNPFWIVTKVGGISPEYRSQIRQVVENGNKILLSICWTNNDPIIEPYKKSRFENLSWMADEGVILNWYMRPLVKEWNASYENLRFIMESVKSLNLPFNSICAGGLRWTEGIEFGMKEIHGLQMPVIDKNYNIKTLDQEDCRLIKELHEEIYPEIPLFFKSGCAVSHALELPQINGLYLKKYAECVSCPKSQQKLCYDVKNQIDVEKMNHFLFTENCSISLKKDKGGLFMQDDTLDYKKITMDSKRLTHRLLEGNA